MNKTCIKCGQTAKSYDNTIWFCDNKDCGVYWYVKWYWINGRTFLIPNGTLAILSDL